MGMFGKGKKQKKTGKQDYPDRRKFFSGIDDYEDEYDDEEYEDDEYYEEESEEYSEEDEEYYGEEYYGDEESAEEAYYGSEESAEGEEYYGDEESAEEYYEEEYYGDDADYYEDERDAGEYDEESGEDEDLYYVEDGEYEDDEEYDDEYDDDSFIAYRKKKGAAGMLLAFRNLPMIDKVIAFTGAAVLLFAVATGVVFMSAKKEDKALETFAEVGTSLNGINIIGESGLLAVADAQLAKEAAAEILAEEPEVVEEETAKGNINVAVKTTSIVKDLKIKFVNTNTDKLVGNVPFEVEVTTPGKKTENWTDDDKDGVIYKENIEAGKYKLKMKALTGYDDYTLSTEVYEVEVKASIAYKKVDVKDEIKTEAEVNAALEDTANDELVEESKLTDTVPFVASSRTEGTEAVYTEIKLADIKNPAEMAASVRVADYYLMTVSDDNPSVPKLSVTSSVSVAEKGTETISVTEKENVTGITWASDSTSVATVEGNGDRATVTGVKAGTATITATGTSASGGTVTASCTVTVTAAAPTLTLDKTALTVVVGETGTIKAESNRTVTWNSTDTKNEYADIDFGDGKTVTIKGKKAGNNAITLTATVADLQPVTCMITITEAAGITPDKTSVQVALKKTADINVKTVPENATITAVSANTAIATVAVNGKKVTVTGVKAGDTIITIKGSNGKEVKISVKVGGYETDTVSKLLDKTGKQVYVEDGNGKYREAVYADYYKTGIKYYLKEEGILYTGWQELNGKMYYYLSNHKYVTGEQVIQGAKYTFASDGSLVTGSGTFGIDVSKWNGNINWNSVKSSGASYAIIRCGYRGSSTGALVEDPKFAANISGANAAGLKVGVYFFTQAVNEKEAVEEASMVLDLVRKYKVSYPIFLDVESSGGRADGIDKATRTAVCKAFCATIQNSGYTAGVYANKTWLTNKIDAGSLGSYKIWLAQYAATPTYSGRYNLWQYSSKGSVPGISGNVDMNKSFLGY